MFTTESADAGFIVHLCQLLHWRTPSSRARSVGWSCIPQASPRTRRRPPRADHDHRGRHYAKWIRSVGRGVVNTWRSVPGC